MKTLAHLSQQEFKLIGVEPGVNCAVVSIGVNLPEVIVNRYELTDYNVSVYFHEDGQTAVFIYDNIEESTLNYRFSYGVKNLFIEFAKQHMKKTNSITTEEYIHIKALEETEVRLAI